MFISFSRTEKLNFSDAIVTFAVLETLLRISSPSYVLKRIPFVRKFLEQSGAVSFAVGEEILEVNENSK
jgi:hypothetical protein